jgi:hypothetical protein
MFVMLDLGSRNHMVQKPGCSLGHQKRPETHPVMPSDFHCMSSLGRSFLGRSFQGMRLSGHHKYQFQDKREMSSDCKKMY